ncbi:CLUMA_CG015121, isoform A [Clunio marinus]|uniref:Phosphatidylinositol 3-kinase catalytic subunit type 3 n=1 Tax=Clunio marinus TaxID=568069 RepID=A0A1J1ITM6_9DIPT|nr:CLUMA_CG015121, isoform A [Clunio marinus]
MEDNIFRYIYSCSLEHRVQIKIGTLDGVNSLKKYNYEELLRNPLLKFSGLYSETCAPLMVKIQCFNNGKPFGLPVTTSYKPFTKRSSWNEWITLPFSFCDLPRTAVFGFTIYDCTGPGQMAVVGGTVISVFGKHGIFREGMFDLKVWPNTEADPSNESKTPGKGKESDQHQMQRLAKLAKKHRNGQIRKVDWLDRLTFREIELINEREKRESDYLYLMIEFPTVTFNENNYSIVYFEPTGDRRFTFVSKPKLVTVPDTEILQENLVERKHHRLARSARSGLSDRDAKPTAHIRDQLHTVVYRYPPTFQLSGEEQDLIWKYRFYLSTQKKALTKFLKCINWQTPTEVRQALNLLDLWTPMDVEDALELLSPNFQHPSVRRYAITRLKQAQDDDLLLYLLQLVQALKYENFDDISESYQRMTNEKDVLKSLDDNNSANDQSSDSMAQSMTSQQLLSETEEIMVPPLIQQPIMSTSVFYDQPDIGSQSIDDDGASEMSNTLMNSKTSYQCDLATFLIQRACKNPTLASYFYWYLSIECEDHEAIRKQDERVKEMYVKVLEIFKTTLSTGPTDLKIIHANLKKQQCFIDNLVKLVKLVTKESGSRKKKTERFQQLLNDSDEFKINFTNFEPRPLPLDPEIFIKGIIPSKVSLFKSALMPSKLTFLTTTEQEYVAIFKHGDDLRQDQLILQMITLMDKLLRKENLDLKLTPYRVLATSTKHGFMQYVESITVAEALANEGSILNFFKKYNPCETTANGIQSDVMDTYIKSCAGYCVITYLLGVGDRHLDNLLLTTNGNLFHIDFGYILGRDPKPLPPPMKLSKEMVEAMGGMNSEPYHEFRKQCYTAFLHLRRHANVMLNLFSLMTDASVPDIALEPDKAVKKVEDNLKLNLTDEEAVQHLQNLLDISLTAVMPALVEQIHKFAQKFRY